MFMKLFNVVAFLAIIITKSSQGQSIETNKKVQKCGVIHGS